MQNKGRNAPNKIFIQSDDRLIIRKISENPKLSVQKLADEAKHFLGKDCSASTIRCILRSHDFQGRVPLKKPFINKKNKVTRLTFAKNHVLKDPTFWDTVIFSDESKLNVFGSDGRSIVWRKPNKQLDVKNLRTTVKQGRESVMVWACMAATGVGNLVFIDENMDKNMYLRILKDNLLQSAEKLGVPNNFRFYQDNDPKHKSGMVQTWLIWNCPHLMEPPAQSSDLNIIENLWSLLETNIRKHNISSKETLKTALLEEWSKITPEITTKLVSSMQSRLKAVISQNGYQTKY